ncbi:T9SS type A sorting domain-containing protein [Marinoscillum furvescens]|uniref:Putative secreted protein (Por secretion system target) n=1 Tax=Marinoscillum furvescens DSM 4134 TaxID=1122208 RepID=A0A3D9L421_MARFU|nr:T9SS type A sorting domain-containing protein [Marinoscillum furvescens]RED98350.1 putative secreted protein (Por secretion system target) [Marinoscillum furvescens DSM 4134]
MRNATTGTFYFRHNNGSYNFIDQDSYTWVSGSNYQPAIDDYDNDGYVDISLRDTTTGKIFLRNGSTSYTFPTQEEYLYEPGSNFSIHALGYTASNVSGSRLSSVNQEAGLKQIENDFKLYPNPAVDIINFSENNNIVKVRIFDIYGNLVLESDTNSEINVSSVKTGMYILKAIHSEGEYVQKLMIK